MELTNEQWLRIEAHHITIDAQERSAGLKIKARKGCDERDIMDITNRSPLEGYAFEISAIPGTIQEILSALPEDLYERGKIDIREAFIDRSFVPAVLLSARQSVSKAPGSWQSQTLLVFLSPLVSQAPRRMK